MSRDASRRALARSSGQITTFGAEPSVALRRPPLVSNDKEFLMFLLGGDPYALPIGVILEILKPLPITEVPRAPRGIAGIASVRGRLVTVIDPRRKFGLAVPEPDRKTRILLVDGGEEIMGLLVDEVKGVHTFEEGQIEPPQVLGGEPPPHVSGVGRNDECWCMLLDLRPVLEVK